MKIAVIIFPGSNRYNDIISWLDYLGKSCEKIYWQKNNIRNYDLLILPGGFAFGDKMGAGKIAATLPIIDEIKEVAQKGKYILGICNGFQILTECNLLPGKLLPNQNGKFICKKVKLEIANNENIFTRSYKKSQEIDLAIAHQAGRYWANKDEIEQLEQAKQVILRYKTNINGSINNIAGIINKGGNICGIMPHPENNIDIKQENYGNLILQSILNEFS